MKLLIKLSFLFATILLISCGGKQEKKKEGFSYDKKSTPKEQPVKKAVETNTPASKTIDLTSKGVGPITSITLSETIDQSLVAKGADVYKKMCTACHRADKKFIGPSPSGILKRRTPEWIMNMILNPEEMVQKDALAKRLMMEFNGAPMANQNLSEEDTRAVLEYFRTL